MARAKCRYCRVDVDTKTAYCVTIKEKNYYFCDEQHYNAAAQKKVEEAKIQQEYDEIFKITQEIFGYEFAGYALLKREINTWEKLSTREKIIIFLNENKDWLSQTMSKNFVSDFNRVRYYSTIISGRLHDFKPKMVDSAHRVVSAHSNSFELFEPTTERKQQVDMQVLFDVEDDLI